MNADSRKIKSLTRKVFRDRRRSGPIHQVSLPVIEKWPQKWQDKVKNAGYIAAYMPIDVEPLTEAFLSSLTSFPVKVCFPRVEEDRIVFYEAESADAFVPGSFSIPEPTPDAHMVSPDKIGIMLIPALAYDMAGTRLGRGKGFYDRFCGAFEEKKRPLLIGAVAKKNLFGSLVSDPWDLKVDLIVTEASFTDVSGKYK